MNLNLIFSFIFIFILLFSFLSFGEKGGRIGSLLFDHSKVYTIKLHIGRVSLVHFPCFIKKATLGSPQDVTATVSLKNKGELFLWLKNEKAKPTNLIVVCEKNTFVFDIKPSKFNHQDYLNIVLSFQKPALKNRTKKVEKKKEEKTLKIKGQVYKIKKSISSKGEKL